MTDQNDTRDEQWLRDEIEGDLISDFGSKEALEKWRNYRNTSFANKKKLLLNTYPNIFIHMESKSNDRGRLYETCLLREISQKFLTPQGVHFIFYNRSAYIKYTEDDKQWPVKIDDIFTIIELLKSNPHLLEISPSICQLQNHFKSIDINVKVKRFQILLGSWYVTIGNDQNKTIGCYNNPFQISDNFINTIDADHFEVLASSFDSHINNQTVDDIIKIYSEL